MNTPENKCEKYCCDGECNHDACCGKITENCKIDCDCHKDTPETMEEKSEKITRDILDVIWPNSFNVSISPNLFYKLKSVISLAISSHNKELKRRLQEATKGAVQYSKNYRFSHLDSAMTEYPEAHEQLKVLEDAMTKVILIEINL